MFVYCNNCRYDSGDKNNISELKEKVKNDGGNLSTGDDIEPSICPNCLGKNTLSVD